MTREEAIKWVDDRMCWGRGTFTKNHPPNIDECWEAGCMAIKALKERPEGHWVRKKVKIMCPRDYWHPSLFAIEGTWNEEEGWNLEWRDGFCSECGKQDDNFRISNYCPNCGARMGRV